MTKASIGAATICLFLISLLFSSCSSSPKGLASFDPQVKELLEKMTLEEKIGQMTQPEQDQVLSNPGDMQISLVPYSAAAIRIPPRGTASRHGPTCTIRSRKKR